MALKGMRIKPKQGWHYGSTRVEFFSQKNRCRIVAQSILEHMEFMRLEGDPLVASYIPHPGVIYINDGAGRGRAIFDAEVHYMDGTIEYEEIKYAKELLEGTEDADDPFRSRRQINLQKKWCEMNGFGYRVITDEYLISKCPQLYNNCVYITQALRSERVEDNDFLKAKAMSIIKQVTDRGGKAIINDLITDREDVREVEETMEAVCFAICEGWIKTDLEKTALCFRSEVKVNA